MALSPADAPGPQAFSADQAAIFPLAGISGALARHYTYAVPIRISDDKGVAERHLDRCDENRQALASPIGVKLLKRGHIGDIK